MEEKTWHERLQEEHEQLKERLTKLIIFMNSDKFYELSPNYKSLLTQQKMYMEGYLNILSIRLYDDVDNKFLSDTGIMSVLMPALMSGTFFGNSQAPQLEKLIAEKEKDNAEQK